MSAKREKKRRYNQKLGYIETFNAWAEKEPPIWMLWRWMKWLAERPVRWWDLPLE